MKIMTTTASSSGNKNGKPFTCIQLKLYIRQLILPCKHSRDKLTPVLLYS